MKKGVEDNDFSLPSGAMQKHTNQLNGREKVD